MAETKIIYHIDEEETPYLVKLSVSPDKVTLADFKNVLNNRPVNSYKFFFKSMDQDFGVVKEEISDDNAKLPCFNGRVVSWLVLAESAHSDGGSQCTESHPELPPPLERTGGIGDSRPPSFHANAVSSRDGLDTETGTESLLSHRRERERERARRRARETELPRINGHSKSERTARDSAMGYDSASVMSSELESSSFVDSEEDEDASRLSSSTEQSSSSQLMRRHKRRRRRHKVAKIDRSSSFSSITDSTMSLNIITVTLNMEKYNFLGISIVGQSNDRGDGGIYIGSIMKGGAVAADGRIEPGDMLLQVNDVNFENMSNDDAVRILREIVSKTGPISLTVAKCWDPSPRSYFTIPRAEPVRPIDPAAWISHTTALTGPYPHYEFDDLPLSASKTDMATIVKVMQLPDSGLEIRDRMWLKITIANAVIGADVVDWLYSRVEGFKDRRDARKYASSLLKHGYLRHTVNKITFSEQCYYTFGDVCQNMASLNLNEASSGGGSEQDTLAPLPPTTNPWPLGGQPFPYPPFPSAPPSFPPGYSDPCHSFQSGSAGSQPSEGSRSSGSNPSAGRRSSPQEKGQRSTCSESEPRVRGGRRGDRSASQTSHHSHAVSNHSHAVSSHSHAVSSHSHAVSSHSHAVSSHSHAVSNHSHAVSSHSHAVSSHSHARSSLSHTQSHRSQPHSQNSHPSFTYSHAPFTLPGPGSCAHSERSHASSYGPPGLPPTYCLTRLAPKTSVSSSTPPGAPPGRELAAVPPELTASRQSFQHAMGNPCEFFVDIM
ncbi:putative segment polarity protein dishevelled homolog DVL1P1 isoform X2 [Trematomus bernacchii]|uniref:putative segment polarity protein dishevelled homolog DVL1P1 isoform X2 n=1 Tax=Trematomus bernacchii TaxID=40690 RepID=UPI00146AF352|nr:putative segment polarity protein dishevelled homolog DVL1P1 isoform X2 [Trematomus bernacchii]